MKRERLAAIGFLFLFAGSACERREAAVPDSIRAGAFLAFVMQSEARFETALADFDAAAARREAARCNVAARQALEAARAARDQVEGYAVPEKLVPSRREELIFLNHAVPTFQAFLAGDAGSSEIGNLRSILARGRMHQKDGRTWLFKTLDRE